MNLLMIHDDSMFSALIVEFLRFQKYAVYETNNAETSLAAVAQRRVDLAICILPDEHSNRFALVDELRYRHPTLPLIALATYPMSGQLQAQLQDHTPYCLTKPFAVESLLSMIGNATGIRKTRISLSAISA